MDNLQKELQELRAGLGEVGQALLYLQGFIESDFGMRFQFQAYKSSSPGPEQLAAKLKTLQERLQHSNQVNPSPMVNNDSNSYQVGGQPMLVNVEDIKRQSEDDDCDANESYPDGNGDESSDDQNQTQHNDNMDDANQGSSSPTKKKSVRNKCSKKNEEMKIARMRGEAYIGSMTVERGNGKEQRMQLKPMPSRKLGPTCVSTSCIRSIRRDCNRFTEQDRQEIFKEFWKDKDWDEKKAFVCAHVQRINPKRKTVTKGKSETLFYFLPLNGERLQVCKNMFLSTVGIGSKMLATWVKKLTPAPPEESERPVKRKYKKHSEKMAKLPKLSKDGFYKCPYCLELSATRTEFSSYMGKHMSQFVWSNS